MKLKRLSPLESLLIFAILALVLLNLVLKLSWIRAVVWVLIFGLVVLNIMLDTCPNCGKRIRSKLFSCPHCGHTLIEVPEAAEENEE